MVGIPCAQAQVWQRRQKGRPGEIALCHFELAAKEVGMNVRFALCDPEISAPNYTEYVASWLLSQ